MGNYDVTYSCGHTGTVKLYGKNTKRDKTLEYLKTVDCYTCKDKKQDENKQNEPVIITVRTDGIHTDDDGNLLVEIVLTGGTKKHGDIIKSYGYKFGQSDFGMLGKISLGENGWIKKVPIKNLRNTTPLHQDAIDIRGLSKKVDGKIELRISEDDFEIARKIKKITRLSKKVRPEMPNNHPENKDGRWNGKYYGGKGNRNYYVDNVKQELTDTEYDEIISHQLNIKKYNEETKELKGEYEKEVKKIKEEQVKKIEAEAIEKMKQELKKIVIETT